jgi:hypothetical protein
MNLEKQSVIISLSNGAEIYLDKDNYGKFKEQIELNQFIEVGDEFINKSHIVGVLKPETMEAVIRRKNGQWQHTDGNWYNKGSRVCCGQVLGFGVECGYCGKK